MSDTASWLSDTQDRVATAQRVLAEVDRGLVAAERVEKAAKRARPLLKVASVVLLGSLVAVGVALMINRRRWSSELTIPEGGLPAEELTGVPSSPNV